MADVTMATRIQTSLFALAIAWFLSGIVFGLRFWDARASFLFFLWSVPFFAVGWVLLGIPVIAMGTRILEHSHVVLGVSGAIAGLFIMLLPTGWLIALDGIQFKLDWSILRGWPSFGAAIGAGAMLLYRWLLSRAVPLESRSLS
jgi:hypothetical protein